jgi:membrane associated rhomboid family serine protease
MTTPSRRDRLRPVELLGISAVIAVVVGLVVLLSTREPTLALVFFGVGFIVVVVVMAMLQLTSTTDQDDNDMLGGHKTPGDGDGEGDGFH